MGGVDGLRGGAHAPKEDDEVGNEADFSWQMC